jgi:FKBP-type peptidyl-prolyl cis-trans isomerase
MNKFLPSVITAVALLSTSMIADSAIKTTEQQISYTIGTTIAKQLVITKSDIDLDAVKLGMQDVFSDNKLKLTLKEMQEVMGVYQQKVTKIQMEKLEEQKKANLAFLEANKKKDGVITLPSGLQYKVIKSGSGKVFPKATDTVSTHYHGTLIDGKVFDSSVDRGEPVSFPVNRVIKGWTEALQKMKVGDKWQLVIPSNLAYGNRGTPPNIGPGATLIFDVELLEIVTAK